MKHIFSLKSLLSIKTLFPFKSSYREGSLFLITAWFLFSYTVFAGAFRKWFFGPGAINNVLLFVQLLIPFIFFFLIYRFNDARRHFKTPLIFLFFLFYLLVTAFNPKNHTVYHGLFGLLIHLGFWVALIAYYQCRNLFEVEKIVGYFIIILVAEMLLASAQYSLPEDHILNIKADGKAVGAFVGDAVRVSGTFSYLGGFQVLITFYAFVIWFLLVLNYPVYIIASVFGLSLYGALMSGSRGALVMFLFVSGFAFVQTGFFFRRFVNVALTFLILAALLLTFGDNIVQSVDTAYDNFSERVEWGLESGESDTRVLDLFNELINFRGKYPVFGIGLGSTYQGANLLFGESVYAKEYGYYEAEWGRIVLEGGFVLFFLRIVVLLVFLRFSYVPLLGKFVMLFYFLGSVTVFNVYQSFFMLFGFMIVDRAYYLKQQARIP